MSLQELKRVRLQTLARALSDQDKLALQFDRRCSHVDIDRQIISVLNFDREIIPGIPALPRECWTAQKATTVHEVGHIRYSDNRAWREARRLGPGIQNLVNIIEDARIEKAMANRFPGTLMLFRFFNDYTFNHHKEWGTGPAALYRGMAFYTIVGKIPPAIKEQEDVMEYLSRVAPLLDEGREASNTWEVLEKAKKVWEIIKEYVGEYAPKSPLPDQIGTPSPESAPRGGMDPRRKPERLKSKPKPEKTSKDEKKESKTFSGPEEKGKNEGYTGGDSDEEPDGTGKKPVSPDGETEDTDKKPINEEEPGGPDADDADGKPDEATGEEKPAGPGEKPASELSDEPEDETGKEPGVKDPSDKEEAEKEEIKVKTEETEETEDEETETSTPDTKEDGKYDGKSDDNRDSEEPFSEDGEEGCSEKGLEDETEEETDETSKEELEKEEIQWETGEGTSADGEAAESLPKSAGTDESAEGGAEEDIDEGAEDADESTKEDIETEEDYTSLLDEAEKELEDMYRHEKATAPVPEPEPDFDEIAAEISKLDIHQGVRFVQLQPSSPVDYLKEQYQLLLRKVTPLIKRTVDEIRKALEYKTSLKEYAQTKGKLHSGSLWKLRVADPGVFYRVCQPSDDPELAIYLLVDCSGSMKWDGKIERARQATALLHEACKALKVSHCATGFYSGHDSPGVVYHMPVIKFSDQDSYKIAELVHKEENRDGYSIRIAVQELLVRPEKNKVLIVLSDGMPEDPYRSYHCTYETVIGMVDTAKAIREAEKAGVKVIGIYFGDVEYLPMAQKMYNDLIYIEKIDDLPPIIGKVLKKLVIG